MANDILLRLQPRQFTHLRKLKNEMGWKWEDFILFLVAFWEENRR